ncbi:MAG: hypothetical protein NUV84_05710 [Candidatus Uhrbacteria bacterium]|nr:hypothetical protein [Candidatus Uhrbacteria bacterium]
MDKKGFGKFVLVFLVTFMVISTYMMVADVEVVAPNAILRVGYMVLEKASGWVIIASLYAFVFPKHKNN